MVAVARDLIPTFRHTCRTTRSTTRSTNLPQGREHRRSRASMPILRALAVALSILVLTPSAWATECPNCSLDFPRSWKAQEQPWGTRVWIEDQSVDVKVQPDEALEPLGPGDVDDELVWLIAELEAVGQTITSNNGRIVRTASREPAVVLDYTWADAENAKGKGVRLVRRCGVRLIFEQRGAEIKLGALLNVSDRVRYTRSECVFLNADVIPLEVLEGVDSVELPDVVAVLPRIEPGVESSSEPLVDPPEQANSDAADTVEGRGSASALTTLLLAVGVLLLAVLVLLIVRGGREDPLEGLPPLDGPPRSKAPPPRADPPEPEASGPRSAVEHAHSPVSTPRSVVPASGSVDELPPVDLDDEHPTADDFGDENTDAILPTGTYGLRGAGGGERADPASSQDGDAGPPSDPELELRAMPASVEPRSRPTLSQPPVSYAPRSVPPDEAPISVPSHAVVSYPSVRPVSNRGVEVGDAPSYEHDDLVRVSPVESVVASLGITTWLDFTAPGISGISYLPASVAGLLEVQNGGRFGYGWLLLLGLRRKNMDLMTINGEPRVKARFGEGWLVGVFAFGSVLWVNPDQSWEIRTLEGDRHALGDSAEAALRRLAEDPSLRGLGANHELVERCRTAVGELLPGWVYRYHGEAVEPSGQAFEPVEIVPFIELLG